MYNTYIFGGHYEFNSGRGIYGYRIFPTDRHWTVVGSLHHVVSLASNR